MSTGSVWAEISGNGGFAHVSLVYGRIYDQIYGRMTGRVGSRLTGTTGRKPSPMRT